MRAWRLGVLAVIAGGCTNQVGTPTPATMRPQATITVSGSTSTADVHLVFADDSGDGSADHRGVSLPYVVKVPVGTIAAAVVGTSPLGSNSTITCEIDIAGRGSLKHTSTAAQGGAVVSCEATL